MPVPNDSFDASLVYPALLAMRVAGSGNGLDSQHSGAAARPTVRTLDSPKDRPSVTPGSARAPLFPLSGNDALLPSSGPHAGPAASTGELEPAFDAPPRSAKECALDSAWAHEQRRIFNDVYAKYLHRIGVKHPPAHLRTVNGVVLDLADVFAATTVQASARLKSLEEGEGLSHEDFAVIAFNLIPGAPPRGLFHGAWLTTAEFASEVMDIYKAYICPVFQHWASLLDEVRLDEAQGASTRSPSDAVKDHPLPSETDASNTLGLSLPPTAPSPVVQRLSSPTAQQGPANFATGLPVRLEAFTIQVLERLYDAYLRSHGTPMPPEAERMVGGKVISLLKLMCIMMGYRNQLGRALTAGDFAGLAVAHFEYPKHRRIVFDGAGSSRLSFWGSTPEIADGLQNLFVRHLKDFYTGTCMQKDSWSAAVSALEAELGVSAPFPMEEYRRFVQTTDIAADIAPDSPAARAAGLVAVEAPGVTAVSTRSPRAQRLFALKLGFSPIVDIQRRVLARIVKEPRDSFWGDPVCLSLHDKEEQEWLAHWGEFVSHRERALIFGPKRIHETLKYDSATEKLLFMLAAYECMQISDSLSPLTVDQRGVSERGFPPRRLVNANTLADWNADFVRIWAHFDRLVGPLAFPPQGPVERVPPCKIRSNDAMRAARTPTTFNLPLRNDNAHARPYAFPEKSASRVAAGMNHPLARSRSAPV